VKVLGKDKIKKNDMQGLLAVNAGSDKPPVFIVMEYNGTGDKESKPTVLVGKGVTFDSGGISLKPGAGMALMRIDMHGSASVIGTMYAVAKAKLPVHLVALVPSTENMPSGTAYLPGDVITYSNGITVEVDNTDAEGRLILADGLIYAEKHYDPAAIIDVATLTGACVIALGSVASGLMSNDDELVQSLKESGDRTHEYVWQLPLYEEYKEQLKSDLADLKNVGGREAGTITAGLFLQNFVKNSRWAHVDIAGTGMASRAGDYTPKNGTGVGVRLFFDMLENQAK
jgi:leucyl aminopeptidase